MNPGFDPTLTPGAHEWFASELRGQETPEQPLVWPDRPDIYWCAGAAGGHDTWHRNDTGTPTAQADVIVGELPMSVCAATLPREDS